MGRYAKSQWKDVKVGDFVHLSCNEMIPADILVLRSSDDHGLCYIDTQNLDGEANLKQREVPRGILDKASVLEIFIKFQPILSCLALTHYSEGMFALLTIRTSFDINVVSLQNCDLCKS